MKLSDELETTDKANKPGTDRRVIIKGAAWSVPLIAAAVATPIAAASGPTCPTCLDAGVLGAITTQAVILGNHGALLFSGALGLDSRTCDLTLFRPIYTSVVTNATLTMSDGTVYTGTGLGSGSGTFGQLGALPGSFLFSNIHFPNGTYLANSNPVHPTKISVNLVIGLIGLPGLVTINCPVTLSWDLNVFGVGTVIFGAGTVNFTGTATGN
ncbi:hypothetical protein [Subtercola endophyticus]|uniref:hypothetical protein n=1 Tax=Subtercola endophyticus TaxID=2895559 RepID=UPI001E4C938A|nr:hypothetical protein [Subtercola endophyticus]UFS60827.1 hypothetical protein LQ955_08860 [Subtercola endophyticus]